MKPRITLVSGRGYYTCSDDTWWGSGWTPLEAYNNWAAWAIYGGTCA